ncbi:MAG: hypothetical protein ABJA82_06735 [Myxococcales bacterium]
MERGRIISRYEIFPYQPPQALAENLWQVEGSLKLPVPRNMTIWRAPDDRLVLYSVIAMHEEGMRALERLGKPAIMVIPHRRHHMDAPFYKARYPDLRVLADQKEPVRGVPIDGPVRELEALGIAARQIPGTSYQDIALDLPLREGRALCVCELLGNVPVTSMVGKVIFRLLGPPGGGFGIARVVRMREVTDPALVRTWLAMQARRTDLRMLLMGHGRPILEDVPSALARAVGQL